jgi:hypothetical protein
METNYSQYYDEEQEDSEPFQDFVVDQLYEIGIPITNYSSRKYQYNHGENRAGIEIKHDKKFKETGNLWIELKEKSDPKNECYVSSGCFRGDNSWLFITGNYEILFIFAKNVLQLLSKRYNQIENNKKTSIGYLMPGKDAEKYAARIIRINKKQLVP